MTTKGIQAHQVADAFNAVPGATIEMYNQGLASGTQNLSSTSWAAIPGLTTQDFVVPAGGLYKLDFFFAMLTTLTSNQWSESYFRIKFDPSDFNGFTEQILGGDATKEWYAGGYCFGGFTDHKWKSVASEVELGAGTHRVQIEYKAVGPTYFPRIADSDRFLLRGTLVSGSGAGGAVDDVAYASGTTISGTLSPTIAMTEVSALELEVITNGSERVEITLLANAYQADAGSSNNYVQIQIDDVAAPAPGGYAVIEKMEVQYCNRNLCCSFLSDVLDAGTHTIKLFAAKYSSAQANWSLGGAQLSARIVRGGQVPIEQEGVGVVDTPRALNFLAARVTEYAGKAEILVPRQALWAPPSAPHANDVEFADGTFPSGWSRSYTKSASAIDPYASFASGDPRELIDRDWLMIQPPGDDVSKMIYRPYSAPTNAMVWARLRTGHRRGGMVNNDASVTLGMYAALSGSDLDVSTYYVEIFLNESQTNTYQWEVWYHNGSNSIVIAVGPDVDSGAGLVWDYVGVHKVGTTYHFWLWNDAGQHCYAGNISLVSLTVAYVGLRFRNASTTAPGNAILGCDFVRFVESATFFPIAGM